MIPREASNYDMGLYVLDGHTPVKCNDTRTWATWFELASANGASGRRVARTTVGRAWVSTVFLGMDRNFCNDGRPLLFETLIQGGPGDGEMMRYCSWQEAEIGHQFMVEYAQKCRHSPKAWFGYLKARFNDRFVVWRYKVKNFFFRANES